MDSINALINIQPNQHWAIEHTDRGNRIICIKKPERGCYVLQTWKFAEIAYVVRSILNEHPEIDKTTIAPALENLKTRYLHLNHKGEEYFFSYIFAQLFLAILGYDLLGVIGEFEIKAINEIPKGELWTINYAQDVICQSDEKIAKQKYRYSIDGLFKTIDEQRKTGKKICLFIGKTPDEPLPTRDGEVWISGGSWIENGIPEDRLHVWLSFNKLKAKDPFLAGKFDKVVISPQKRSLYHRPDRLDSVANLLHDDTSELIIDGDRKEIKADFEKQFDQVECHENETFPYDSTTSTTGYFVLKQPKKNG